MFTEMIVYCETEQTFKKASEWVSSLPLEAGQVYVTSNTCDLDKLLLMLLSRKSEEPVHTPTTPTTTSEIDSDRLETDTESESNDNLNFQIPMATGSDECEVQIPMATAAVQFIPVCVPVVVSIAPAVNPVLEVLGPMLSSYSAQELNHALEQAMPDCYVD